MRKLVGVLLAAVVIVGMLVVLRVIGLIEGGDGFEDVVAKDSLPTTGPGPCFRVEEKWLRMRPVCDGPRVVSFRIRDHLDIRRNYNPSAGEETNTIEESHERPWYERQFIRVNWPR